MAKRDLGVLKTFLNRKENFEAACFYANRTLHVQYDKEIAKALEFDSGAKLSYGAKKRLEKIIKVLVLQLRDDKDDCLNRFVHRSIQLLNKL